MKCNLEWLSAYLDGVLAEDKRAKLEEHLKTCEVCTAKLEEFARVEQTAKKIPEPQLSEAYWENFANRVQNKLTIREKRKTSPGWLEALKGLFQPTTGKFAIAGSVAVIILLTFVSLDQWKKETFHPPVFEDEKPVAKGKADSVQVTAKDGSEFRRAEKDNKAGLVENKRLDQSTRERETVTLTQIPAENVPAASAPVGRMLVVPKEQKSKEEPSLAAFAERDEGVQGDTVIVPAGRKAEIRKEVATSQVKVGTEEKKRYIELKRQSLARLQSGISGKVNKPAAPDSQITSKGEVIELSNMDLSVRGDTVATTAQPNVPEKKNKGRIYGQNEKRMADDSVEIHIPGFAIEYETNEKGDTIGQRLYPFSVNGNAALQARIAAERRADVERTMNDIRQVIAENEKRLKGKLSESETDSLYIYLAQHYVQLYRFSLDQKDWEKANERLNDFLKTDLSETNRRWLLAIQGELKQLKK